MPRKPRIDAIGMVHHVMNRGVGRRPIFERPDDYRYFKMLLACAVRDVRIRILGFCLMPNHYHLIVESLDGKIGETMRRIQALFAGRFNRTRDVKRPGHLFGARFKSFPIQDQVYLFTCVGYLDLNPVEGGLCQVPWEYEHGSAKPLITGVGKPLWLCAQTMERILAPLRAEGLTTEAAYRTRFAVNHSLCAMGVVAARISGPAPTSAGDLDLDGLLGGEHTRRRAWLERQAQRADGTGISAPLADTTSVSHAAQVGRARAPEAAINARSALSLWDVLQVGLLRSLAAQGYRRIGQCLRISTSAAATRFAKHRAAMQDDAYANVAALTARAALAHCYGPEAIKIARAVVRQRVSRGVEESS